MQFWNVTNIKFTITSLLWNKYANLRFVYNRQKIMLLYLHPVMPFYSSLTQCVGEIWIYYMGFDRFDHTQNYI